MNPKTSVPSPFFRLGNNVRLAIALAAFAGYTAVSHAAPVTLTASDATGASSFNSGVNWSDTFAPSAGKDYSVGSTFTLRTPATTGDFTFAGNSLTIGTGGALNTKSSTVGANFTINNFALDGGTINNSDNTVGTAKFSGNSFGVTANGGSLNTVNGPLEFASTTTSINGTLNVINTSTSGSSDYEAIFDGMVSFGTAGKLTLTKTANGVAPRVTLASSGTFTFDIGASGTTYMSAGSTAQRAKQFNLNGTFDFTLGAEDLVTGNSWNIINPANATLTYGGTFAISDFTDNSGLWTSNDGDYQFNPSTGILSVVPEPGSLALGALGIGLLAIRKLSKI
jgi:hypothetical protein